MPANLLLILALGVDDDLRKEAREDVFEELGCEIEGSPVVSLFHDFQHVT